MGRWAAAALLLAVLVAGCGEGEGASEGATVTAYVAASLCGEAKRELEDRGARAGELDLRIFCLAREGSGRRVDLAAAGANARRATEDSTAIGYLDRPGTASRFSAPILEAANVPVVVTNSGRQGMSQLLGAVEGADTNELRDSIRAALE